MARPKKARLEGEVSEAERAGEAEFTASAFADAVSTFKANFPEDWEALRLCPLQHGLDAMIEKLSK